MGGRLQFARRSDASVIAGEPRVAVTPSRKYVGPHPGDSAGSHPGLTSSQLAHEPGCHVLLLRLRTYGQLT